MIKKLFYRLLSEEEKKENTCEYEIVKGRTAMECGHEPHIRASTSKYGKSEATHCVCKKHMEYLKTGAKLIESEEM